MAENVPCLPLLFLSVAELRRSKNAASKIMTLFQFQAYFGRQKEEVEHNLEKGAVREGTSESWYGILWKRFSYNFCISCQ
jgi:hypothetical protein